jgi:hypothetical protein
MGTESIKGGSIRDRGPAQPRVADLATNRTLLVADVNPKISNPDKAIEAGSLAELVQKVQALAPIELQVELKDVLLDEATGASIQDNVLADMAYGDQAERLLGDFEVGALVAKVQTGPTEASETQRRLLMRQRLTILLIRELLVRIAKDKKLSQEFSDPTMREAIVAALDQEISRLEPEVKKAADARVVAKTGGVA